MSGAPPSSTGRPVAPELRGRVPLVAASYAVITRGEGDMSILETTMAVDPQSFAPVSTMMQSWAAAFQLDYDGWECAVVSN